MGILLILQQVDLVHDQHDLLSPVPYQLQVTALALGQGTLGRGDEQHQVAPRHEAPAQLLVVADDGVRPRRVHDGDLLQKLVRMTLLQDTVSPSPLDRLVAVAQDGDAVRRRCHALAGYLRAEQRIDEGGLPRVELANDHEQEELLEICMCPPDELRVLGRRPEVLQESYEPLQEVSLPLYQSLPPIVEDPHLPDLPSRRIIVAHPQGCPTGPVSRQARRGKESGVFGRLYTWRDA